VRTPNEQEAKVVRTASTRWSKPIQTQEPATTSAGNWLDSQTVQTSSSSAGGNLTATNATASDNGIITVDLSPEVTTPASPGSEPVATQDLTDSNHEGEDVASPVKPLAGGRQLIKGSPSGKAPDTDNTMPDRGTITVLGETFKPDSLECENCGNYNSSQLVYCQNCAKFLAAPDTTSEQKEHLARQIIESTLKDYGIYWRPLLDRGVPSDEAAALKEARNKVKRAKAWGQKNGHPDIVTVEQRWDNDEWFRSEQIKLGLTRSDMVEQTELSYEKATTTASTCLRSPTKRSREIQTLQQTR
jgi:hypothetical protein